MRSRRSNQDEGETSDATTSNSAETRNGSGDSKVRRHSGHHHGQKSLIVKAWTLIKTVFFTIVHIYKSLTAFWSQMHVCMLPALGELDHQDELDAQQREQEEQEQDSSFQGEGQKLGSAGSPQRKRVSKEH